MGFLDTNLYVAYGSAVDEHHFVQLGSSLSLRRVARMGSAVSALNFVELGSSLSVRSFTRVSSSCSIVGKILGRR